MKRPRIGDIYAVKVPNGYKLFQWAYRVPQWGDFIRVFDGLYESIPSNIAEIVSGPHSYIIPFNSGKLYRIGLSQWIGHSPAPEEWTFPDYMLQIPPTGGKAVRGLSLLGTKEHWAKDFKASCIEELPPEYRDVQVIGSWVHPAILLELFDIGFNLNNLDLFWGNPHDNEQKARWKAFEDMVEAALEQDKMKRNMKKQKPHKE